MVQVIKIKYLLCNYFLKYHKVDYSACLPTPVAQLLSGEMAGTRGCCADRMYPARPRRSQDMN